MARLIIEQLDYFRIDLVAKLPRSRGEKRGISDVSDFAHRRSIDCAGAPAPANDRDYQE
jgi:hypothetical protein